MSTKQLREQRAKLVAEAQALVQAGAEMSAEVEAKFDKLMADADKLKGQIDRIERADAVAAELAESRGRRSGTEHADEVPAAERKQKYRDAFWNYVRHGAESLNADDRMILRGGLAPLELRAAQTSTTSGGGYTIPEDFSGELEKALLAFGGVRALARILRTPDGRPLPWPTVNDTTNKATLVSENTQSTETAVTFGVKQLDAYTYRSMILAPIELLMDAGFNLNAFFMEQLAERVARGTNTAFTTGTGSSQPQGVVGAASAGKTAASSSEVGHDDLVDLVHSVDPAYRTGANVGFMFADSVLKSIKKLKDSQNRPLWLPGLAVKEPDTILGYRYAINQDMAAIEASAKSVLFGDFSKFVIRDVSQMITLRLTERYADYGQVGFIVFSRHDSELINAGTNPIKYLIHPSP